MLRFDRPTAILAAAFPVAAVGLVNGYYKEPLNTISPLLFWLADALHIILLPAASLYLLARLGGIYPHEYGFRNPIKEASWLRFVLVTALISFAFWVLYETPRALAAQLFDSTLPAFSYHSAFPESGVAAFATALYFAITAGFVEETVFRALPWLYFRERLSPSQAILPYAITTAIVFGFIHWENNVHEVIATGILGFFIAVFYAKLQNIWPFIIGHSAVDHFVFTWY